MGEASGLAEVGQAVALTTRKMSNRHESDLVNLLGGEGTKNSGAVWNDQADGHQTGLEQHYKFSWDGKATLGKSIGVTREMWNKLQVQCRGLDTLMPLRWYANDRLTAVDIDLVVLDLELFAQILADANTYRAMKETGCAGGIHDWSLWESNSVPGMMIPNGPCKACGESTYSAGYPNDDD